nr:zinc finger, CCHC-type, retrotransposon Gag domain protein [Tanacetum cinerariifolium]
ETSTEFMQRFLRLAGFLGSAAGTEEEQAKNFQCGLRRSTLNHLMCMSYTDVAQVANAARNYEILHERDDDDTERPDKRQRSGDRHQSTSQQSSHRSHGQNNDRHGSDRRGGNDNHRGSNNNNNYSSSNNRNSGNGRDQRNRGHQSIVEGIQQSHNSQIIYTAAYQHTENSFKKIMILVFINRDSLLKHLRKNLLNAQDHMKANANRHRHDLEFKEGEFVLVKVQPYRQVSVANRLSVKLSPSFLRRFIGPLPAAVSELKEVPEPLEIPSDSQPEKFLEERVITKGKYRPKTKDNTGLSGVDCYVALDPTHAHRVSHTEGVIESDASCQP